MSLVPDLSVEVAVIARPGTALDACLGALAGAGVADPRVVRVRDVRGGLADARNRALVACRADVLAYVEDDVVVAPTWLDGVHHAFGTDALRACAGGPLRPRTIAPPPWLSDDLLVTFGLAWIDGPARELVPSERTFPGGSVAFRAAALRGVGGFWPACGHPLARDWFGEDHHAQHELARAGWTARFEPAMAAERVIDGARLTRRDVLLARLRYGSRFTLMGGTRPPQVAARQVAAGLVGAPLALLRGDRPRAMARLARASENAGVLLGPLVAHADLQPVTSRTPFAASIPPPAPHPVRAKVDVARSGLRPTRSDVRAAVLLYHRVADTDGDPLGLTVAPAHFAEQLDALGDRLTTLDAIVAGDHPDGAVAVTFDDGYADNLTHAAPALDGRPATLFVTTGWIGGDRPFWWDVVAASGDLLTLGDRAWPPGSPTARGFAHAFLQPRAPEEIARLTAGLEGQPDGRPMTVAELQDAARAFDLGAHTVTHRSLAWADPETQRDELTRSADALARWTGRQPRTCSYPFGVPGADVDRTTQRVAREAGFTAGLLNHPGVVTRATDRFALPRLVVPDVGGGDFAAWLDAHL